MKLWHLREASKSSTISIFQVLRTIENKKWGPEFQSQPLSKHPLLCPKKFEHKMIPGPRNFGSKKILGWKNFGSKILRLKFFFDWSKTNLDGPWNRLCEAYSRGPLPNKGPPGSLRCPYWSFFLHRPLDNVKLKFTTWFQINPTFSSRKDGLFDSLWAKFPRSRVLRVKNNY